MKWFLHQIKHTKGNWDKGIVVKDSYESAKQGYHAYLGAYAYDNDKDTDYVQCEITDSDGLCLLAEVWNNIPEPVPEPDAVG